MTTEAINYLRATATSSSSRSSVASSTSSPTPPLTPNGVYNMRAPSSSSSTNVAASAAAPTTLSLLTRGTILFLLGSMCALVLNILQMEYKSNLFPSNVLIFLSTTWWVLPLCGLAAGKTWKLSWLTCLWRQLISSPLDHWSLFSSLHRLNVPAVRSSNRSSCSQRRQRMVAQHQMLLIVYWSQSPLCCEYDSFKLRDPTGQPDSTAFVSLFQKITFSNSSHFLVILISLCILFWYWFDKTKWGLFFNVSNALAVILSTCSLRYMGIFR